MSLDIWFWQRMVTPHMVHLAKAVSSRGHRVTYVAEQFMSPARMAMGWSAPDVKNSIDLRVSCDPKVVREIAREAPRASIHITQGFRSNGVVSSAQKEISARSLRHFVIMETVDQRGLRGHIKPALYAYHLWRRRNDLEGILAIGAEAGDWLRRKAPSKMPVHPFAYFLSEPGENIEVSPIDSESSCFQFLFVGSLIPLKRVDLLLRSLECLASKPFTLDIIGDGPQRRELQDMANILLPGRVRFHGTLPISKIDSWMAAADCLVLPSIHDGWGAVISEALLSGTPVICSSACGAKSLVKASNHGGVFEKCNPSGLVSLLDSALQIGKISKVSRHDLRQWGRCAGSQAGAAYLENILMGSEPDLLSPPWRHSYMRPQ